MEASELVLHDLINGTIWNLKLLNEPKCWKPCKFLHKSTCKYVHVLLYIENEDGTTAFLALDLNYTNLVHVSLIHAVFP